MAMTVKIRKWGSSLGVILPVELVKMQKLKAGQEVSISVFRDADSKSLFGILPELKSVDRKRFIKESKEGWNG